MGTYFLHASTPFLGVGFLGWARHRPERLSAQSVRTFSPDGEFPTFESLSNYGDYCKLLVKTSCIDNPKRNPGGTSDFIPTPSRSESPRCAIASRRHSRRVRPGDHGCLSFFAEILAFRTLSPAVAGYRWRATRYGIEGPWSVSLRRRGVERCSLLKAGIARVHSTGE